MVDYCFGCTQPKELTLEHIVPQAVGGRLKAYLYCKECNDKLGREIDTQISKQFGKIVLQDRGAALDKRQVDCWIEKNMVSVVADNRLKVVR